MSILDLFAKSPFKPLQEHAQVVLTCVREVVPLFEALCAGDDERLRQAERHIDELEGDADRLKNGLRAHLPKRLLLPVDRRDLLEILDLQDSIADVSQDIAGLLVSRKMEVPEQMQGLLLDLVRAVDRTCVQGVEVVDSLDELVEIGFRGREADRVEHMIENLGTLEDETDRLEAELRSVLFQLEGQMSPVSIMLWYHMIDWIGDLADLAEKVGNRIRLLIAS